MLWTPAVWTPNSIGSLGASGSAKKSSQPMPPNASLPSGMPTGVSSLASAPVNERAPIATMSSSPWLLSGSVAPSW